MNAETTIEKLEQWFCYVLVNGSWRHIGARDIDSAVSCATQLKQAGYAVRVMPHTCNETCPYSAVAQVNYADLLA